MSKERLDKIIASQGQFSRSEVRDLVRKGSVTVNGAVVRDSALKVDAGSDKITVCGKPFGYSRFVYIMLNKPKGVVSASRSPQDKTVVDLVPTQMKREGLFPAGRLDKDTTGFVLITDDGDFAHRILSPKNHIEKTYIATLSVPLSPQDTQRFRSGVTLADGYECLPAKIEQLNEQGTVVEIKLKEGKYHQIKRMAAACGSHVDELKRVAMGGLKLDEKLAEGECRFLSDAELEMLAQKAIDE